jgi:hypothetical protein
MQLEHLSVLPSIPINLHLSPEALHSDDVLAAKTNMTVKKNKDGFN